MVLQLMARAILVEFVLPFGSPWGGTKGMAVVI